MYVNLTGTTDNKKLAELLYYIKESSSGCKSGTFPKLAKRVTMLKEVKEGVEIMCDIIDKERAEGEAKGEAKIISLIRKKLEKHNTPTQAADALEMDIPYVQQIMSMLSEYPQKTDQEIAKLLIYQ